MYIYKDRSRNIRVIVENKVAFFWPTVFMCRTLLISCNLKNNKNLFITSAVTAVIKIKCDGKIIICDNLFKKNYNSTV